jgi:hypothetical protein
MNGLLDPSAPANTVAESQVDYPRIEFHIYPDAG